MDPEPYYQEDFWKSRELINIFGDDCYENGPCRASSWVVCGDYWSGPWSLDCGMPLIFPTVSDCLLWFRWIVLPYCVYGGNSSRSADVVLAGDYQDLAAKIDLAMNEGIEKPGDILDCAFGLLENLPVDLPFYFRGSESIHDFLMERGTIWQWRNVMGDESVGFSDGKFTMADELWEKVRAYILSELVDCCGSLPEFGPGDEHRPTNE